MNGNLYNYLNSNYSGSVKQLDNGVLRVKTSNWTMYINPNSTQDVNLVVYYPGSGGMNSNAIKGLTDRMTSPNPDNHVAILSQSEYDPKNVLEVATKILNDNGYNISGLVTSSNSFSGGIGIARTADYLTQHPELVNSTVILSNDGYSLTSVGKNAQILIDNQVPIVLLAPDYGVNKRGSNRVRKVTEQFAKQGYNVFQMETKDDNHGVICTYSYVNGVPEFILGIQDELGNSGVARAPEYVLYKYNPQTGQYEVASMEDMRIASSFKDIVTNLVDPSTYKNTTFHLDTSLGVGKTSTLASDMNVVMDAMNDLSSTIKNSSFASAAKSCTSTTAIPAMFYDSQKYLFGVSSTLADNIGKESAVIANIAQAIYNMDVNLSQRTNGLNDPVNAQRINSTLNEILSTDITIPFTSFVSPFTTTKVTKGKAGKLCMSDLKALLSGGKLTGSLASGFETDNANTQKTIDSIKSFQDKIAANTSLQGDIWKEVSSKLDNYKNLLNQRLYSNDKLASAYEEAIKLLEDYMGDYDELDDSMIDELKDKISKLKSEIDSLQSQLNKTTENYDSSTIAKWKKTIEENQKLVEELSKKLEKLEGLWEVINKAIDIVTGAVDDIKTGYAKSVSGVAVAAPEQVLGSTGNAPIAVTNTPLGSNAPAYNSSGGNTGGSYSSGGYSSGGYSGGSSITPSPSTESTPVTNMVIPNIVTESNTPVSNEQTQQPVVENTPAQNQTIINNYYYNNNGGTGSSHSAQPPIVETPPQVEEPVVEEIVEEPIIEEPVVEEVIEEPIIDEPIEEEIVEPEEIVVIDEPQAIETPTATQKSGSALKTVGVLAGVGLAAGAAAYAANEFKKSNDSNDEDYNY